MYARSHTSNVCEGYGCLLAHGASQTVTSTNVYVANVASLRVCVVLGSGSDGLRGLQWAEERVAGGPRRRVGPELLLQPGHEGRGRPLADTVWIDVRNFLPLETYRRVARARIA